MRGWLLGLIGCLSIAGPVWGEEVRLLAAYQEPSQNTNGTALTNLAYTSIWYDLGKGPVLGAHVEASSPRGGGQIIEPYLITRPAKKAITIRLWTTATNTQRKVSAPSVAITVKVPQ